MAYFTEAEINTSLLYYRQGQAVSHGRLSSLRSSRLSSLRSSRLSSLRSSRLSSLRSSRLSFLRSSQRHEKQPRRQRLSKVSDIAATPFVCNFIYNMPETSGWMLQRKICLNMLGKYSV